MTDNHSETRELAAELALDVAAGEERGRALAHLEACRECRALVGGLADAKEEILLLAPEREPSAGFESRTLARLARVARPVVRAPRWRRILSLSVAASIAAAAGVGTVWVATRSDRQAADLLTTALQRADGKYLGVEVLRRPDGTRVGHMAVYLGRPSWIFAIIDDDETSVGTFDVEVVDATGARHPAGVLTIDAGGGGGLVLPSGLGRVTAVMLIPRDGGDPLEARLPSG